jgi:hypothetical protein
MRARTAILILLLIPLAWGTATATRYMTLQELEAQQATIHQARPVITSKLVLPVYREAIARTARFMANMQVSDSASTDFGGVREAEDDMNTIQTDNTQEGIWVWSRYYQLFSVDSFLVNIRRAWYYNQRHPAWREEGTGTDYYRNWNCGLGLFAESKYREVYGDTFYLRAYTDSCISFLNSHSLNFNQSGYTILHPFVTGLYAGMLYHYWRDRGVQAYHDTAVARGTLVKNWIQANARTRLQSNVWAMSGGTALWGTCNSVLQEDTTSAKAWLNIYVDSMNFFQPSGTWNNSWNIYRAWAYRAAWEVGHIPQWQTNHKRLVDTLLAQDQDLDGGIPDTWNDPQNTDAAWTSSYLDFMGLDYWVEPSGVAQEASVSTSLPFFLGQSFPNPARSVVSFVFSLFSPGEANLTVYNVVGEKVATLADGHRETGLHQIRWVIPGNVRAGIYFYRLEAEGQSRRGRMVLTR